MKAKNKKIISGVIMILSLALPVIAQASLVNCGGTPAHTNECTLADLFKTVINIINFLLSWAWLVSILMIVAAGFRMVFYAGNEEAIGSAKAALSSAIIGFILVLFSFVIVNLVIGVITGNLGVDSIANAFNLLPK